MYVDVVGRSLRWPRTTGAMLRLLGELGSNLALVTALYTSISRFYLTLEINTQNKKCIIDFNLTQQ